jgi:hypothetical protein
MRSAALRSLLVAALALGCATLASRNGWFAVHVVDDAGRPVPCVRLTTTNQIVLQSDQDGVAAFFEPGLMGRDVFFTPEREGYAHAADPSGVRGRALDADPGGSGTLVLERTGTPPACDADDAGSRRLAQRIPGRDELFRIDTIDVATGRGVPRVELRAPGGASWLSDSQGVIAFDDTSALGTRIHFVVSADGYRLEAPEQQIALEPVAGGRAVVPLERNQIAERLYRITGAGIYRDSARLGLDVPTGHPLLNAGVAGQDSVQAVLYRGEIFWTWGDTPSISHPLWNFDTSGARSRLPADGGLDPARGVELEYSVDRHGEVRPLAPISGPGATWLSALLNVPDARGEETLIALYAKHTQIDPPDERGFARYDPVEQTFDRALVFPALLPIEPKGSALLVEGRDGVYAHYGEDVRIPARAETLLDFASWEAFTPYPAQGSPPERAPGGELVYAWRRGVPAPDQKMLRAGGITAAEVPFGQVRDAVTGAPITPHHGSIAANAFRGRFVRIFTQLLGSSRLGEIWYQEGDTPMGPWLFARKIVTHRVQSFYNPMLHPFFDQRGGRTLFFEGTYTAAFSGGAPPTPREDYNQVMHRLDLEDPRLFLPVPIYDLGANGRAERFSDKRGLRPQDRDPPVAFFAFDRPAPGTVAVYWTGASCSKRTLAAGLAPSSAPLFWAFARGARPELPATVPLPRLAAGAQPAVFVFANPFRLRMPVSAYLPATGADAGPDLCERETQPGAGARVKLDATRSRSAQGAELRYEWSWPGGSATGARAEIWLPAGVHDVRLELTTPDGVSSTDALVVEVAGTAPQAKRAASRRRAKP